MALYYIYEILRKNWKLFASLLLVLVLLSVFGFLCVQNKNLRADLKDIQAQQQIELAQIQAQNERIERLSVTLKSEVTQAFAINSEKRTNELQAIHDSVAKSNATTDRLYTTISNQTHKLTNTTPSETLIRYINVLSQSYRETNDAYGEAGESLERARVELAKCNSDMEGIYSAVDTYNASLLTTKGN